MGSQRYAPHCVEDNCTTHFYYLHTVLHYARQCVIHFCVYYTIVGSHVALSPIFLVELVGLDNLTTAYGIITLVRGMAILIGPPLAGKSWVVSLVKFYRDVGLVLNSRMRPVYWWC